MSGPKIEPVIKSCIPSVEVGTTRFMRYNFYIYCHTKVKILNNIFFISLLSISGNTYRCHNTRQFVIPLKLKDEMYQNLPVLILIKLLHRNGMRMLSF